MGSGFAMRKKGICSHCKIGKDSFELDKQSVECPYITCHNGESCPMFKAVEAPGYKGFLARLKNRLKHFSPIK